MLTVIQPVRKFSVTIETEGSLLHSKKPTNGPNPKPVESSPHQILFL